MENGSSLKIQCQMLIRKPAEHVFEALVNPEITRQFWFTKSSGRLQLGRRVRLDWEMFGVGDTLFVKDYEANRRLLIEWENDPTTVEWLLESRIDNTTLVRISNWNFTGNSNETLSTAIDAKGGYTMVLAGLKAYLEHGIRLNLIADQFPDGCPT